ncbi:MAG: hypothetical protein ACREFJ_02400 [Acetobacteraceae bacterium]
MPTMFYGTNPMMLRHLLPLLVVIAMVLLNLGFNRGYMIFQARRDSRRHRAALAAELASLLELVRENLRLIRANAGYVLSSRSATAVYRGTIGRLTNLCEAEIAVVVPTYVLLERLEATVAARTKAAGPGVYRLEAGKMDLAQLRREYFKTAQAIEKTLGVLTSHGNSDGPHAAAAPVAAGAEVVPLAA